MKNSLLSLCIFFVSVSGFAMGKTQDLPRFYEVTQGEVYRSGQPSDHGYEMLTALKVRTILSVRNESDDQIHEERAKVTALGMNFISIPLSGILSPSKSDMERIEDILEDPRYQPVLIHCLHGEDRTGLAIGLYRVFHQHVEPKVAYHEMIDYGFHKILVGLTLYFKERTGYDD